MPKEVECVDAAGGIGNQALYRMCAQWPKHTDASHVSDKIIVIGRVYAASPSRGMTERAGKGFTNSLAEHLVMNSMAIDRALDELRETHFPDCCKNSVVLHEKLDEMIVNFSRKWQDVDSEKRYVHSRSSFVSKYLHFHAPDVYPILDKYSEIGLKKKVKFTRAYGLSRYARFCAAFTDLMGQEDFRARSLRSIDTELVRIGREEDDKRRAQRAEK